MSDDVDVWSFDDSAWTSLDVPHDWSISLAFNQSSASIYEGGYLDGGLGWYRKTSTLPASSGQKVFVQFDGVYMDRTVYLNTSQQQGRLNHQWTWHPRGPRRWRFDEPRLL